MSEQQSTTVTLKSLWDEISARDKDLAPVSETTIWGDFVDRMAEVTGGASDDWDGWEPGPQIPASEAAWWTECYDLYDADQAKPADQQATDIQDIYDAVDA